MMRRHPLGPPVVRNVRVATAADSAALERMPVTAAARRILRAAERVKSIIVHVAEQDSVIVGVGCCGDQRSENLAMRGYDGEISLIYVLPEFQRRGVGADLLASMARDLAARGFHEATSWVARESAAARRFYAHYGGQVVAEQEHVIDNTVMMEFAYAWTQLGALHRVKAASSH